MDWKICAVDDLRRYKQMKIGIINSKEKLKFVENTAMRYNLSNAKRGLRTDTNIINALVEASRLRQNIASTERLTKLVERGLDSLSDEERRIIDRFYMANTPLSTRVLSEELGYEPRTLYRIRDRALEKFTIAMYGIEIS